PTVVSFHPPFRRRRRAGGIALQPGPHVIMIELLRPKQSPHRLAENVLGIGRKGGRNDLGIELMRFGNALFKYRVETVAEHVLAGLVAGKAQAEVGALPRRYRHAISGCHLRALGKRIDGMAHTMDDIVVYPVFDVRRAIGSSKEPLQIRLVLSKE